MSTSAAADDVLFVADDLRVTRAEFEDRVARGVRVLRQLGIDQGSKFGIAFKNRPQFFELLVAATVVGATSVPIAWRLQRDEVQYLVEDSMSEYVFYDEESAGAFVGVRGFSLEQYEQMLAEVEPALDVDPMPARVVFELYSSGTTGRPKAIERDLPPATLAGDAQPASISRVNFLAMMGVEEPDEVHLLCGPLYHSQPIGFATQAFGAGQRVVMMDGRFDAERCLATIERERVTWITCVPTHLIRILALPDEVQARYDLSSIKAVLHSAAPCPSDVKRRAMDLFPADCVWEIYGGTEGSLTMLSPQEAREKPGSVGRPFPPGTTLSVRDANDNELPAGDIGLIYGRSPMGRFHYRGTPELDASTWKEDRFTLGDVGYLDEDGYLYITDRQKDLIITGGANVYPAEVEAVLFNHPAVADVAVIGVPDPEFGESVMAVIETRGCVTADEIIAFCRQELAHYKCPKTVNFVDEMPRDPNGKVRKRLLREPFWADAGRAV